MIVVVVEKIQIFRNNKKRLVPFIMMITLLNNISLNVELRETIR